MMSDKMDIEDQNNERKNSLEEMELESRISPKNVVPGTDLPDFANNFFTPNVNFNSTLLKVEIPDEKKIENDKIQKNTDVKHSPPVLVNNNEFQSAHSPFQKPTVCRTHSLGASDQSPFTIRRRPARLSFATGNSLKSPSAFKRQKLRMQSPIRGELINELNDDNVLKRCNSAPMLNEINDMDARISWQPGSLTPGSIRARRFSATVLPVHASPSAGTAKSTSRLHQLKKEESIEGIQYKEAAHEREVQTSIQMYHTCEELSLSDSPESLNGLLSGAGDGTTQTTIPFSTTEAILRSPLPQTTSVNILSVPSKQCPTRAIDFNIPGGTTAQHHGGIPSPLTISPQTGLLSLSPLPPSPTRNLGFSSTGKQCFSPSMQAPVHASLRNGSVSPSPSPTRRTFVTRRRSQSPCIVKPSVLGPIKRKYDSDSEGGCSPKRMFLPGSQTIPGGVQVSAHYGTDSLSPHPGVISPFFAGRAIHRSHSLSSSSMDSDVNVSPSPPQSGNNIGFLPSSHPLGITTHVRESSSGSPFQSPLHMNPFLNTVSAHEPGRCSSPASSTCSSSSLEGIVNLPPYPQSHLVSHSTNNVSTPSLLKPNVKERQPSSLSTANITL